MLCACGLCCGPLLSSPSLSESKSGSASGAQTSARCGDRALDFPACGRKVYPLPCARPPRVTDPPPTHLQPHWPCARLAVIACQFRALFCWLQTRARRNQETLAESDPGRTRACNLWFRRPTPYPLGHRTSAEHHWRRIATQRPTARHLAAYTQDSACMRDFACMRDHVCTPHYLSDALVLKKRMILEDESNTHLALGKGVRGACTCGHGKERVSIRLRSTWTVVGA